MNTYFRTTLLGLLGGAKHVGAFYGSPLEIELLTAVTKGTVPAYSNTMSLATLDEVATIYFLSGEIDEIFKKRAKSEPQKIFASNDMLFRCIGNHYACEDCKGYRRKIRDIFRGTLLEILCAEGLLERLVVGERLLEAPGSPQESSTHRPGPSPTRYPFLYDFLILAGNIRNDRKRNPRDTNLLISRIDHFLCKENMFMIDILINNYGIRFISNNNWYLNNVPLVSDRFVTLLLLEYNFDTAVIDTVMKSFDADLDFITNMLVSKFNLEKRTFAYAPVSDLLAPLYKCLKYVYDRTPAEGRDGLIMRVCNSFAENITTAELKWKLLDVVMEIQKGASQSATPLIPIIYDKEPQGGYKIGKYFGSPEEKNVYDVIDNRTFVFPSGLTPTDENKRVSEIYTEIKEGSHSYLSFEKRKFDLSSLSPYLSNLVFHIYCDVNDF